MHKVTSHPIVETSLQQHLEAAQSRRFKYKTQRQETHTQPRSLWTQLVAAPIYSISNSQFSSPTLLWFSPGTEPFPPRPPAKACAQAIPAACNEDPLTPCCWLPLRLQVSIIISLPTPLDPESVSNSESLSQTPIPGLNSWTGGHPTGGM